MLCLFSVAKLQKNAVSLPHDYQFLFYKTLTIINIEFLEASEFVILFSLS